MHTSTCVARNVVTMQRSEPVVLASWERSAKVLSQVPSDDDSWYSGDSGSMFTVPEEASGSCVEYGYWHESGGADAESVVTILPWWLAEPWWRSCPCTIFEPKPILRKYKAKKVTRDVQTPEQIWGRSLWWNPQVPGNCFFEALAVAVWNVPSGRAMRKVVTRRWRSPSNGSLLVQTAMDENMSGRAYIAAVSRWMWGGRPEARVFADHRPVAIWCWTPQGALVNREAGYADSWGNACPVIDIHLGLHAKHYVLLRAAPSEVGSHDDVPSDCRAGGPRSRTRVRIFPRSQVASRHLRLRSRARQVLRTAAGLPTLPRRRKPSAAGTGADMVVPPSTTVADLTPVVGTMDDPRPPLPRRRRVQQQDGSASVGASASQDIGAATQVKAAKSKRLAKPGGQMLPAAASAGLAAAVDSAGVGQEVPGASGASSSSQAATPSYLEQALQLTQMKVIRDLPRSHGMPHRSPTPKSWWPTATVVQEGGSSGSQMQAGEVKKDEGQVKKKKSRKTKKSATQVQPDSQVADAEILSWGNSWLSTEFWKTGDQKGQDIFCNLCGKWADGQHLTSSKHVSRVREYGPRPQSRKGADALKLQQDILDEGGLLTPETWVSEVPASEPHGESPPRFGFPDDYARPAPAATTESQHKGRHSGGGLCLGTPLFASWFS